MVKRHYNIKLTANSCIALCSSRNAVRISSARYKTLSILAMCFSNPIGGIAQFY